MRILFLFAIGIFCLLAAIFDWVWWFSSRRARVFVDLLSREGARVFYGIFGVIFILVSIGFMMN